MTTTGEQLRALREACGYSLHDVLVISGGKWQSSAIGAWERGARNGGLATIAEYVADMYGRRPAFIPADVTDDQLAAALRVLAGGVSPEEFAAALAIARLLEGRAVAVADGWQVPSGRLGVAA